jgi:hypothetical protein
VIGFESTAASSAMQRSRPRGRLKALNKPISPDNSVSSSPHPHEVARVFNTMVKISAAGADIIRREEVYPIYLLETEAFSIR